MSGKAISKVEGVRFLCIVLVIHKRFFFSQEGNRSFPLENWKSPMPSELRWLTTCLIFHTLNVRKSKGSGIMSGTKLPAQSWKAYLDLPRFFHANPGLLSEDLILTWNTTAANSSLQQILVESFLFLSALRTANSRSTSISGWPSSSI